MKIIKAGLNFNEMHFHHKCSFCQTQFEFQGEEAKTVFLTDKRGTTDAYMVGQCPNCTGPFQVLAEHGRIERGKTASSLLVDFAITSVGTTPQERFEQRGAKA